MSRDNQINIIRGNTTTFNILFKDNNGAVMNITDYTVWFTVRATVPATSVHTDVGAVIAVKQLPAALTDPLIGKTTFTLTPTNTDIDPGIYVYDVQYSTDDDDRYSSAIGNFSVTPDITRE